MVEAKNTQGKCWLKNTAQKGTFEETLRNDQKKNKRLQMYIRFSSQSACIVIDRINNVHNKCNIINNLIFQKFRDNFKALKVMMKMIAFAVTCNLHQILLFYSVVHTNQFETKKKKFIKTKIGVIKFKYN